MARKSVQSHTPSTRARPTRADPAQASPATTVSASTATATAAATARCISLAGRVCDQVAALSVAINGYLALESFVSPEYADEAHASVRPSRGQLSAMLRSLNADVFRHIDALAVATTVLQAQMSDSEAQAR